MRSTDSDSGATPPTGAALGDELDRRLEAHLHHWLGLWPPTAPVVVVGSTLRDEPGWDGRIRPVAGVATPTGAVLSVPPAAARRAATIAAAEGLEGIGERIGELLGVPGAGLRRGVFRYCRRLVDLDEIGEWVAPDDPRVPEWLAPFNGDVLVAFDHGLYAAGVGRKRHDALAQELAVATEPDHRRRGLARSLVAQAARRVVEDGGVATYLHRVDNEASAAVAESTGFPDVGWQVLGLPTAS